VLAAIATPAGVLAGAAVWGLHMGLTQGILAAMVADTAPKELKGTAFGVFNLAGGVCALLASVLAGGLWQAFGGAATFEAGAALAVVSLAALLVLPGRRA
jgi:MFS family permease